MGILTNAKALSPAKTAAAKGDTKHKVALTDLELYAQVDTVIKACEGVKKTLGTEINAVAMDEFVKLGQNGVRPESFTGFEGNATASIELRKRSTASVLTDDECAELTKLGIPYTKAVIQPELFGIDPKYAQDMAMLEKVEKALAGIVPDDFFFKQELVEKNVVTNETVAVAFSKKAPKSILKLITTQAIKAKLAVTNMADVLLAVKAMLVEESDAEVATKALAK